MKKYSLVVLALLVVASISDAGGVLLRGRTRVRVRFSSPIVYSAPASFVRAPIYQQPVFQAPVYQQQVFRQAPIYQTPPLQLRASFNAGYGGVPLAAPQCAGGFAAPLNYGGCGAGAGLQLRARGVYGY